MTATANTALMESELANSLDVLIIGAGFAGVGAAIRLRQCGIDNIAVLEKAGGIGGTWWHNTYPGAACDIASHLYCYSFEPNPDWSRKYSPQAEIQAYIERCAEKYDVKRHIRLNTRVAQCRFDEQRKLWLAELANGTTVAAHHVIFATGGLHLPAWPDIPGRQDFAGPSMHSAEWDHSVDFRHKRVAVIGSAASAIQLIPELARVVEHLDVYQRTPNYIAPRKDREFSAREKALFARWPWWNRLYRQAIFLRGEWIIFPLVKSKGPSRWRARVEKMLRRHIRRSVADPGIREAMIPDYPAGCKRLLIADNFYEAINRPNVTVITTGIERIETDAVVTRDGARHPVDIIVYATGFDMENYMRQIEVIGPGGAKLSDIWARIPFAYKGGFVPGLPNFYFTTGPNTGVGTTSVVYMIEAELNLIIEAILLARRDRLIEVSAAACQRYNEDIRAALQQTVWAGSCKSWYKRPDGEIASLYPYNARTYLKDHRKLDIGDFVLREAG